MAKFVYYCPEMVKTSFKQPDLKKNMQKTRQNKKILLSHYHIQGLRWEFEIVVADD